MTSLASPSSGRPALRALALLLVLVLVGVVAATTWYRSDDARLHRLVDDLRERRGVVASVEVGDDGIREVRLTDRASAAEVEDVRRRLADAEVSPRVRVGEVRVDLAELRELAPLAVRLAGVYAGPATVEARVVSREQWVTVDLAQPPEGGAAPRPAEGAEAVLAVLDALGDGDLPPDLAVVGAARATKELDLVHVRRAALERLDATIEALRRVAATDPDHTITCDQEGCRAG